MSEHLDRIRRQAGIGITLASSNAATVRPASVSAVLESATWTRTDLTSLQIPAAVVALAAAISAALHRFVLDKLLDGGGQPHALQRIAIRILDFAGTNVWAPWAAGCALLVLAVVALHTRGFNSGTLADTIAGVVGIAGGAVAALPATIALAYGLVVLAVAIAIAILVLVVVVWMIVAMLSEL